MLESLQSDVDAGLVRIDMAAGVVERRDSIANEEWSVDDRYSPVRVEFVLASDMAAMFSVMKHGGKLDKGVHFCAHCMEHSSYRDMPLGIELVTEDVNLGDFAKSRGLYEARCST